jgi:hypothetical protein
MPEETELEVRQRLEYLREACRELLGLPKDAPDEDIIDTLRDVIHDAE